jgi:hypothetical protein
MNVKTQAMLASYARAVVVAVVTAITMGKTDSRDLLIAAAIAVLPPLMRAINPKDSAFGIGADLLTAELNKLVKADQKKTVAKKATPKKP